MNLVIVAGPLEHGIKNEAKRKKRVREKYNFEFLNIGEGK